MDLLASLVRSVSLFKQTEVATVQENPSQFHHLSITNQVAEFVEWISYFIKSQSTQLKLVYANYY